MGYRKAPPELRALYERPGSDWNGPERIAYKEWLHDPEQFSRDSAVLGAALYYFARRKATKPDVEDVLQQFYLGGGPDRVIDEWNPSHPDADPRITYEPRFWRFYDRALWYFAHGQARRILTQADREQQPDDRDGQRRVLEAVDEGESAEARLIRLEIHDQLQDCVKRVLTEDEWVVVRGRLDDVSFAQLGAETGEPADRLRKRFERAKAKLRACLKPVLEAPAPSRGTPTGAGRSPDLDVDVLIIGGGVMGLWLLNALRRLGFSAILLERDRLGGGQTCHSHLYIHRGLVYSHAIELPRALKCAEEKWRAWLDAHPQVKFAYGPSIFGFRGYSAAQLRLAFWAHPDLAFTCPAVTPLPDVLADGEIRYAYESPERGIRGDSLIAALREPVDDVIGLVTKVTFTMTPTGDRIERVVAMLPETGPIDIRPRAVVLAAGSGNQQLLNDLAALSPVMPAGVETAQQIRKSHMVAIEGPREVLPPLTGVFALTRTLFIVSRQTEAETVWLVSDERGPHIKHPRDEGRYSLDWWWPGVKSSLIELAPTVFDGPHTLALRWLPYEAPKAEVSTPTGVLPHEAGIRQFGLRNMWAVWPTKLTLAPLACETLVADLGRFLGPASRWSSPPRIWSTMRREVPGALERWQEATPDIWKRTW